MIDTDLERRLRRLFDARAAAVESTLSGPDLRTAAAVARRRPARLPAALATAATVVGIAVASAALDDTTTRAPRSPAGHSSTTAPQAPASTTPPTPNVPSSVPAPKPSVSSPAEIRVSQSGRPVLSLSTAPTSSPQTPGRVAPSEVAVARTAAAASRSGPTR